MGVDGRRQLVAQPVAQRCALLCLSLLTLCLNFLDICVILYHTFLWLMMSVCSQCEEFKVRVVKLPEFYFYILILYLLIGICVCMYVFFCQFMFSEVVNKFKHLSS